MTLPETRFHSFVMLAEMRTGSNFLESNLNAIKGVACHGEAFNAFFIGGLNKTTLFGIDLAARDANPAVLLARMREKSQGLSGFRYFHSHDARVFDLVMDDPACAKIVLTRNPVESYVSLKIAKDTNQWKLTNAKRHLSATATFVLAEFEAHLQIVQEFQIKILHRLQVLGQTAFYIDYDDISDVDVVNGLAAFLGVEGRLRATDQTLKKQNPETIAEKVSNPREMEAALAKLDRFNLSRTPNFEPRRTAAVPHYIGSTTVPLLFLPIKAGPEAGVRKWMEGFGAVVSQFDRKSLRLWKTAHPGFRSFTVLRHPLARAHAAFCDVLGRENQLDLRAYLERSHALTLPHDGEFADAAAFRAAFLLFLDFLRRNLAAQTGMKVSASFASQLATLQGQTSLQPADHVLREDRMAEGLAYICADLGLAMPPVVAMTDDGPFGLRAIYDADLEAVARAAYDRDYAAFGFGNWTD